MIETPTKIVLESDIGPVTVNPEGFTRIRVRGRVGRSACLYGALLIFNEETHEWAVTDITGSSGLWNRRGPTVSQKRRIRAALPPVIKAWADSHKASYEAMGQGGIAYNTNRLRQLQSSLPRYESWLRDAQERVDNTIAEIAAIKTQLGIA